MNEINGKTVEERRKHITCDICGYEPMLEREFYGSCPRCGASTYERYVTRGTKIKLGLGGE